MTPAGLHIPVVAAAGAGPTELAAFDAALTAAGVANRNLICLSSVLPPDSHIRQLGRLDHTPGGWGDRLYCVLAEARTAVRSAEVWAGIGWMQDRTGRGLLVEHHADTEAELRDLVDASLDGLARNRGLSFPHRGISVASAVCDDQPVCALVVAVYAAATWQPAEQPRENLAHAGVW